MKSLLFAVLSLWSWVLAITLTIFFNLIGFAVSPISLLLDRRPRSLVHRFAVLWAQSIMSTSPFWRLHIEGQENIEPGAHYVVVANHQSMLDILAALAGIPLNFRFLAKKELFSIPFLGWHMALAGYIPIDRDSPQSGHEALVKAGRWLDKKVNVLFFPEGTRSLDGEIKRFKAGAFRLAQEHGVKILPVVMDGTGDALPKKSWVVQKGAYLKVSILKPVTLPAQRDLNEQVEKIRGLMSRRLHEMRQS